jgi:hypothetical protein
MEWGNIAQWAGATATSLAVLVALFREPFVRWWRRPILNVIGVMGPPHSHKIAGEYTPQVVTLTSATSLPSVTIQTFHFRLWIENEGKTRAEQVQVFAASLSRRTVDGSFKIDTHFLPMNLRWSHDNQVYAQGISPKIGKHCDLGHIIEPSQKAQFKEDLPGVTAMDTVFALALEVQPQSLPHLLAPGTYRLELHIAAANSAPVTKTLEIVHSGNWFDDEEKMFQDGIVVRVVK